MKVPKGEHKNKVKKKKLLYSFPINRKFYRDDREYQLANLQSKIVKQVNKTYYDLKKQDGVTVTTLWINFFLWAAPYEFITIKSIKEAGFSSGFYISHIYRMINEGYLDRYLEAHKIFYEEYKNNYGIPHYEVKPARSRTLYCLSKKSKAIVNDIWSSLYDDAEVLED